MATFKVRVEDIIGAVSDDSALSDWLTEGARRVIVLLPESKLENYPTTALTDSGTGVSIASHRPIRAHKSGYGARRIDAGSRARAGSSSSIHYAVTTDPVWYIELSKAFVLPSGGSVIAVAFPTVAHGESTIASFPIEYENAVVLYTAIRGRLRQIYDLINTSLGGLSFSTQIAPTVPTAPSFTYTDATYTDAAYTDAEYTQAIYVNALIDTIASTSISFTDELTYVPPAFTGVYSGVDTALTNTDVELANGHLNKVNSQLDQFQKDLFNSLNDFNKEAKQAELNLQEAISQAQLTQQRLIEQTRNQVELNKFNAQQALQEALQNASQESNVDLANRRAELELDITNKTKALEAAIINESKELERQIQEYQAKLQRYGSEIQAYVTQVNEESQRFNLRIQQYVQQSNIYMAQLQALMAEYNEIIKDIKNG